MTEDIETAARAEAERRWPDRLDAYWGHGAVLDARSHFEAGASWLAAQQPETRAELDPKFVETAIGRGQQLVDRWNHASDEMSTNSLIRWADAAEEAMSRLLAIARHAALSVHEEGTTNG